jgi:hypothetical protein
MISIERTFVKAQTGPRYGTELLEQQMKMRPSLYDERIEMTHSLLSWPGKRKWEHAQFFSRVFNSVWFVAGWLSHGRTTPRSYTSEN